MWADPAVHIAIAEADLMISNAARWLRPEVTNPNSRPLWKEDAMEEFIHREKLVIFKRHLAETKNDVHRQMLAKLLAEEEARDISTIKTR
jgi:hypothetical protein